MNRGIALRASCIFMILTILAALTGVASGTDLAEILFLVGVPLASVMLFFALTVPDPMHRPIPVRVRRKR